MSTRSHQVPISEKSSRTGSVNLLLQRATEWDTGGLPENRLLSGGDIAAAKAWAARRPKDAPEPTTLHLDFIRASEEVEENRRNTERRRLEELASAQAERAKALEEREIAQKREVEQSRRVVRRTLAGLGVALLLAVVAGAAGFFARQQQQVANAERDRARVALAQVLAERSWGALSGDNKDLAIRYALSGWRVAPSNAAYYRWRRGHAPRSVHWCRASHGWSRQLTRSFGRYGTLRGPAARFASDRRTGSPRLLR